MNLCSHTHEEICFDGRICPICVQIADLEEDIRRLQDRLDDYKAELEEAAKELRKWRGEEW